MLMLYKLILLLSVFGLLFSIIPKFTFNQVNKLLTYHRYPDQPIKRRFIKVIRVYTILGLTLGFVFLFLLSSDINPKIKGIGDDAVFPIDSLERIGLSFIVSFFFVIILRISTLLNKTRVYCIFLSSGDKQKVIAKSNKFDYKGLKAEVRSFLFSIFLTALLSLMIFFVYNLLFRSEKLIKLTINQNYDSISTYLIVVLIFTATLFLITWLSELLLNWIGVHPKCQEDFTYDP